MPLTWNINYSSGRVHLEIQKPVWKRLRSTTPQLYLCSRRRKPSLSTARIYFPPSKTSTYFNKPPCLTPLMRQGAKIMWPEQKKHVAKNETLSSYLSMVRNRKQMAKIWRRKTKNPNSIIILELTFQVISFSLYETYKAVFRKSEGKDEVYNVLVIFPVFLIFTFICLVCGVPLVTKKSHALLIATI